jgi:hypothetical protein
MADAKQVEEDNKRERAKFLRQDRRKEKEKRLAALQPLKADLRMYMTKESKAFMNRMSVPKAHFKYEKLPPDMDPREKAKIQANRKKEANARFEEGMKNKAKELHVLEAANECNKLMSK